MFLEDRYDPFEGNDATPAGILRDCPDPPGYDDYMRDVEMGMTTLTYEEWKVS